MNITTDTPDLLVLRFTRWKESFLYGLLALHALWIASRMVVNLNAGVGVTTIWLLCTVTWLIPLSLLRAEKSMLVLNATTGEAELRHRDIRGTHNHTWPLDEVQSTRVTRHGNTGPAADDPKRILTLFVREGMDEGRHPLTNRPIPADAALAASARVSDWMKDWRNRVDSTAAQP